jgi:hypothetical protein
MLQCTRMQMKILISDMIYIIYPLGLQLRPASHVPAESDLNLVQSFVHLRMTGPLVSWRQNCCSLNSVRLALDG